MKGKSKNAVSGPQSQKSSTANTSTSKLPTTFKILRLGWHNVGEFINSSESVQLVSLLMSCWLDRSCMWCRTFDKQMLPYVLADIASPPSGTLNLFNTTISWSSIWLLQDFCTIWVWWCKMTDWRKWIAWHYSGGSRWDVMLETRMTNQKHICILNPSPMIVIQVTQENSHKEITSKQLQLKSSSQNHFVCICAIIIIINWLIWLWAMHVVFWPLVKYNFVEN